MHEPETQPVHKYLDEYQYQDEADDAMLIRRPLGAGSASEESDDVASCALDRNFADLPSKPYLPGIVMRLTPCTDHMSLVRYPQLIYRYRYQAVEALHNSKRPDVA